LGRGRVLACCSVLALAVLAVLGWIAAPDGTAARTQDPEPTTVSTPTTTEPTPDPAPAPAPPATPKPTPKPKPKPAQSLWKPASSAPAPQSVSRPSTRATIRPVLRPRAPVRPKLRPRVHAKPKPKKRAPVKTERRAEPLVKKTQAKDVPSIPVGGVAGASAVSTSGGSEGSLFLLAIALAIFCFALAAVPWPALSSRMAYLVTPRQPNLTLLGLVLLVAAAFTYVLTRGP
jgi:hypothetical protein